MVFSRRVARTIAGTAFALGRFIPPDFRGLSSPLRALAGVPDPPPGHRSLEVFSEPLELGGFFPIIFARPPASRAGGLAAP